MRALNSEFLARCLAGKFVYGNLYVMDNIFIINILQSTHTLRFLAGKFALDLQY